MSCVNCPEYILATLRRPVAEALGQVNAIKARAIAINNALSGIVGGAAAEVLSIVALIPAPPGLSIADLLDLVSCPVQITLLALGLDPGTEITALDPRELYRLVQRILKDFMAEIIANYESGLSGLSSFQVIKVAKRYLEDLLRIRLSEEVFAQAIFITGVVKVSCPDDEFLTGPYQAFEEAITDFSLTGVVPSGLDSDVTGLMVSLESGEAGIGAWRLAATAPFPAVPTV